MTETAPTNTDEKVKITNFLISTYIFLQYIHFNSVDFQFSSSNNGLIIKDKYSMP